MLLRAPTLAALMALTGACVALDGLTGGAAPTDDAGIPEEAGPSVDASDDVDAGGIQTGDLVWLKHLSGPGTEDVNGLVTDSSGNIWISGAFENQLSVGSKQLTSAGAQDAFLVKLDSNGDTVLAQRYGGTAAEYGTAIAIDDANSIYQTVSFTTGPVTIGTTTLTPFGDGALEQYVAKFDPNGAFQSVVPLVGPGSQSISGFAGLSRGVAICGSNTGTIKNFLGSDRVATSTEDVLFAKLFSDADWVALYPAKGFCNSIARDAANNTTAAGIFRGTLDFSGGKDPALLAFNGEENSFMVRFSAANTHIFTVRMHGTTGSLASARVDDDGNSYGGGVFGGVWQLPGGTTVTNSDDAGANHSVVFKLNALGEYVWSTTSGNAIMGPAGVDPKRRLFGCGRTIGDATLGGVAIKSAGGDDALIVGYAGNGEVFFVRSFGDSSYQDCRLLRFDSAGNMIVAGNFAGTIKLGNETITTAGATDIYVAKFKLK